MADHTTQIETGSVREIPSEWLRHFLLGQLSPREQAAFEIRLFQEDSLARQVRLAECELADDYAYECLSEEDCEQCKTMFLVTPARMKMTAVSAALRDRFGINSEIELATAATSIRQRKHILQIFSLRRPVWRLAVAAAFLALVVGIIWLISKQPEVKNRIANWHQGVSMNRPQRADHRGSAPEPSHTASPSPAREHQEPTPNQPSSTATSSPIVINLALDPGVEKDIELPPGETDVVRLQLELRVPEEGNFEAAVRTAGGKSILQVSSINADKGKLNLNIPSRLLSSGAYIVDVRRLNAPPSEGTTKYKYFVRIHGARE